MTSPSKPLDFSGVLRALVHVQGSGHPVVFKAPDGKCYTLSSHLSQEIELGSDGIEKILTTIHLEETPHGRR